MDLSQMESTMYPVTDDNVKICAEKITNGEIVVFPTETVYGLGANSLDRNAVEKIYRVKNRPNNNPLIMHVLNWRGAKLYTLLNSNEEKLVQTLVDNFWPGPLTILVKKSDYVPSCVSSGTEWVSLRSPANEIARKLLEYSMVPIVAPSANMSGKITSTHKDHIIKYFRNSKINMLLDEEPTQLGVESTILKIDNNNLIIVRPGVITKDNIMNCLSDKNEFKDINISIAEIHEQVEHPGSNISHYAPDKKTMLFNFIDTELGSEDSLDESISKSLHKSIDYYLTKCACVDFNSKNFHYRDKFGAYVDLSKDGDINEALFNLYNVLHQLDNAPIDNILIFDYWAEKEGLYATMFDRVMRSCSGMRIVIPIS